MSINWDDYVYCGNVLPKLDWLSAGALIVKEYGCSWEEILRELNANGVPVGHYNACPRCTGPVAKVLAVTNHNCKWCGTPLRSTLPTFDITLIELPVTYRDFDFKVIELARERLSAAADRSILENYR